MLEWINLKNLGPAPEMKLALAARVNLITGDNGLGKTLLLDAAWWALTRMWPAASGGKGIVPKEDAAAIRWSERRGEQTLVSGAEYDFGKALWLRNTEFPPGSRYEDRDESRRQGSLVIYLRVDGGISIYDPLRAGEPWKHRFGRTGWGDDTGVFQFQERDIWDGLELVSDQAVRFNEGFVRDVVRWAVEPGNNDFEQLAALVEQLCAEEPFRLLRRVERVYVDDPRDFPLVAGPTGELAVAHAPAGLRRILGLAYLVVWTRREHKIAAGLKKRPPNTSLVLLIDELENHLHPKWQRTILPSILRAFGQDGQLQVIATTHSPMVLASVEPVFDVVTDKQFLLDLENHVAVLREKSWAMQGDVINWLVSDAFGLQQARSAPAEKAIEAAEAWMRGDRAGLPSDLATKEAIHAELQRLIPGHDPFWPRWIVKLEKAGGLP